MRWSSGKPMGKPDDDRIPACFSRMVGQRIAQGERGLMQLSYSKLSTFSQCGFRYKLRYLDRVPVKPKPYLRFGSVLHSVLGKFYLYPGEGKPELDYLLSLYQETWPLPNKGQRKHYERGPEILKEYYARNIASWRPPLWAECVFNVPIGEHTLTGVFDRVDELGDRKYEVIDYKAQKAVPTQEEVDADLQLTLYALAFQKITGEIPHLLSVYHLRENRKLTTVRTGENLHWVTSEILRIAGRISRGKDFQPEEGQSCKWCDYVAYCPVKAEAPLPLPEKGSRMKGERQMELDLELR